MGLGSAHLPFIIAIDLLRATDALTLLLRFDFDNLFYSPEVMARCSPLNEVATANAVEVENVDRVADAAEVVRTICERYRASDGEGHVSSPDVGDNSLGEGASDNENSRTYYFGSSTITVGKIKEMVEKGYSRKAKLARRGLKQCWSPTAMKPLCMKIFFVAGLHMPPHPALPDIFLKFQAQLHQLMPNTMAQFSKYFWAVGSFGACLRVTHLQSDMIFTTRLKW
jgi:hypothetical protein